MADRYVPDPETARLLARAGDEDPNLPYWGPPPRRNGPPLGAMASGAGSDVASGGPALSGAPSIDRPGITTPDAILANIMRAIDEVGAAGDLQLAAEIAGALVEIAGGGPSLPMGSHTRQLSADDVRGWLRTDDFSAGWDETPSRLSLLADDDQQEPEKQPPSPAPTDPTRNAWGGGQNAEPVDTTDNTRDNRATVVIDRSDIKYTQLGGGQAGEGGAAGGSGPPPTSIAPIGGTVLGDDESGPSGSAAFLASVAARYPGLARLLAQGLRAPALRGGTAGGLDYGPEGRPASAPSSGATLPMRRGWADEPTRSPVLDPSAITRRLRSVPGGGGDPRG